MICDNHRARLCSEDTRRGDRRLAAEARTLPRLRARPVGTPPRCCDRDVRALAVILCPQFVSPGAKCVLYAPYNTFFDSILIIAFFEPMISYLECIIHFWPRGKQIADKRLPSSAADVRAQSSKFPVSASAARAADPVIVAARTIGLCQISSI